VVLQVTGNFVTPHNAKAASLVIELSRKPLIILFWAGTVTMFLGGIISTIGRRRQLRIDQAGAGTDDQVAAVATSDAA
jgi:cytochrome c biogenesis factor